MKLLTGYYTKEEATDLQEYLEENGIAVHVEYEGVKGNGLKYSVFTALDSQYQDALLLMETPSHIVVHRADVSDYQAYVAGTEGKAKALGSMLKGMGIAALLTAAFAGLIIYFVRAQ